MYSGLITAIHDAWKRSISDCEQHPIDVASNHLTPANVTSKNARQTLVLGEMKPPNIEKTLVEKNIHPRAIYESSFKVTVENKLRYFQFKVIHNILPSNNLLFKMKLESSPSCVRCNFHQETLVHLLYEGPNVQKFWQKVIAWWNEKRTENITLNATGIMYGYKPESTLHIALNHFLILGKYHIFQSSLNDNPPPPPLASKCSLSYLMIRFYANERWLLKTTT